MVAKHLVAVNYQVRDMFNHERESEECLPKTRYWIFMGQRVRCYFFSPSYSRPPGAPRGAVLC